MTAGLFADFTVDKAHRTVLPALMLQRALAEYAQKHFDVAYAYPNDAAVGIFSRIGYEVLGRAGRYVRVLRSADYLRRAIPMAPVAAAVSVAADLGLNIVDRMFAVRAQACVSTGLPTSTNALIDCSKKLDPNIGLSAIGGKAFFGGDSSTAAEFRTESRFWSMSRPAPCARMELSRNGSQAVPYLPIFSRERMKI